MFSHFQIPFSMFFSMTPQKPLSASLHFLLTSCSLLATPMIDSLIPWAASKVGLRQFAGYADVDEKKGKSLFYYVAEVDGYPEKKPLTLWFNGDLERRRQHSSLGESSK